MTDDVATLVPVVTDVPGTIDEVIDRLERVVALTHTWPPGAGADGVACFSRLYLQITQGVKAAAERGEFRCGTFIEELDVAFARRYLAALGAWASGDGTVPGCWSILFSRRADDHPEWRFAAAGVNAHVNFDLAFALLDVWAQHPDDPLSTSDEQYADYDMINRIFYRNMESLSERFDAPFSVPDGTTPWERIANVLGDVLVWGTRDLAWIFAERMWTHRDEPGFRTGPTEALDLVATGLAKAVI